MKARTKKTRWLLLALLFGLLAAAGLTLTRHHGRTVVAATVAPTPPHAVLPQPHAVLLAATGGKQTLWAAAGALRDEVVTAHTHTYSNSRLPQQPGTSDTPSDTPNAVGAGASDEATGPTGNPAKPSNTPATAADGHLPQGGAGELASNGYVPLDCELPAGCGVAGSPAIVSRQPSGTSGGLPGTHDSGSVPGGNTNPGTPGQSNDLPNSNSNGDPPSNRDPPVAAAPELDPATLAGAVTLLLGSLALLRRRRVRASH